MDCDQTVVRDHGQTVSDRQEARLPAFYNLDDTVQTISGSKALPGVNLGLRQNKDYPHLVRIAIKRLNRVYEYGPAMQLEKLFWRMTSEA